MGSEQVFHCVGAWSHPHPKLAIRVGSIIEPLLLIWCDSRLHCLG